MTGVGDAIKEGMTRIRALKAHKVSPGEYRQIAAAAEAGDMEAKGFMSMLDEAEAALEASLVATVTTSKDWHAAMAMLERRFPEEWGQKIQIEVEEQLKEIFRLAEATLPEAQYLKLLEAVSGAIGRNPAGAEPAAGAPGSGAGYN